MDYSRRKANFTKELEECKKSTSDRTWAQEARISALKVELSAAKRRISQLEGNSSVAQLCNPRGGVNWVLKNLGLTNYL